MRNNVKPLLTVSIAFAFACSTVALASCAPASLGSPPSNERTQQCRANETLVCYTHDMSRIGKDEDKEHDICICESLDRGIP